MNNQNSLQKDSPAIPQVSNSQGNPKKLCRICFELESNEKPLISPCQCDGSIRYIHEECLKTWILFQVKDPRKFTCDLCKSSLKMDLNSKFVISCKDLNKELLKILIYPFLFFAVSVFIAITTVFLYRAIHNSRLSFWAKVYLAGMLISCVVLDLGLLFMTLNAFKAGCFQRKIIFWKIFQHQKYQMEDTVVTEYLENKETVLQISENITKGIQDNQRIYRKLEDSHEKVEDANEKT